MSRTHRVGFAATLSLLFAGSAAAQEKGAPPAPAKKEAAPPEAAGPQPSKELDAFMKGFEGSWKCDTRFPVGSFGPGSPEVTAKSTVKFSKDKAVGGMFWRGDYEVKKQKGVPGPFTGIFYVGWDPGSQQVIVTGVDSMGGLLAESGKIEGEKVSYSGEGWMMGKKVKARESMWGKGKEGGHSMEVDMGQGFQLMGEDHCKR